MQISDAILKQYKFDSLYICSINIVKRFLTTVVLNLLTKNPEKGVHKNIKQHKWF